MNKTALLPVVAFLAVLPINAQAQNADSAQHLSSTTHKSSIKPTFLSGEIGKDGKTLRADRDSRIWRVSNPEILSDIETRHVRVRAQMDATHGQIHILSVSVIPDERAGIKLDDAAFRR